MSVVQCVTKLSPPFLSVLNHAELSPSRLNVIINVPPEGGTFIMWINDQHCIKFIILC